MKIHYFILGLLLTLLYGCETANNDPANIHVGARDRGTGAGTVRAYNVTTQRELFTTTSGEWNRSWPVREGHSIKFTATARAGSVFSNWKREFTYEEDQNLGTNNPITKTMGSADYWAVAYFDLLPYTISISVSGGGTITGGTEGTFPPQFSGATSGNLNITPGSYVVLKANPKVGWVFSRWSNNVPNAQRFSSLLRIRPTGNTTYTATFTRPSSPF